jgi:aspartyl-tRNA(Asn)/glutamyl-tRNA(Gln) amidotransferase subunit C
MTKVEITSEDIKYLEGLARLKVDEADISKYAEQISDVLDYVKEIQTLDFDDSDVRDVHTNDFREDDINQDDTHILRAIQNAPDHIGNLYKVSQVIKQ